MKTRIFLRILVLVLGSCLTSNSYCYGQDASKTKKRLDSILVKGQRDFYRQSLQIDSVKADRVLKVQDTYKNSLRTLMTDTTMKGIRRQERIQVLIDTKNLELGKLLTPAQQAKIIPISEQKAQSAEVKKINNQPIN